MTADRKWEHTSSEERKVATLIAASWDETIECEFLDFLSTGICLVLVRWTGRKERSLGRGLAGAEA